jgi:hypothetical protein
VHNLSFGLPAKCEKERKLWVRLKELSPCNADGPKEEGESGEGDEGSPKSPVG